MTPAVDPGSGGRRGSRRRRRIRWAVGGLSLVCLAVWGLWILPFTGWPLRSMKEHRPPATPAWALECWVWEDDRNDAAAVRELLDGYRAHDLPVRTVLIDSPWSTRYNDFRVDTNRYPDPENFFRGLESDGYRVVLWMTCMVDSRNKDTAVREDPGFHREAAERGYLAGGGRQVRWWKGTGGFIDYTHPDAMEWWHGLQRQVLDWGVDGWKLDGADTLFSGAGFLPFLRCRAGRVTTRRYMDLYAREEYRHGLSINPEFIVLTRAVDDRYWPLTHPEGFAPRDAAPVTWIGDRTHEWSSVHGSGAGDADAMIAVSSRRDIGFEGALRDILASARLGYGVIGSDIGGYHGREPIPPRLYIRWAQFAAFTGLFLNGGHGERRLWLRSPEELAIIRRYAWLHTELVPYLHTHVVRGHEGGLPMIRPNGPDYGYLLGDDLFISPIHRDTLRHRVHLPTGRWRLLLDDREAVEGPATLDREFGLEDFPAYVRDGAILPLQVSRPYTGFGDRASEGFQTWAIWPDGTNTFVLHQPDGSGTTTVTVSDGEALRVTMTGVARPHVLRIRRESPPSGVWRDGRPLREGLDWNHDPDGARLWIRTGEAVGGEYRIR